MFHIIKIVPRIGTPEGCNALNEAENLGKPFLYSVDYAACHLCHVLAYESFENPPIARVMNKLFVNIKLNPEERPGINGI